jgi:hypothetical protein
VPSVERVIGPAVTLSLLGVPVAIAGCVTTQQEAARIQVNDARIRASQVRTTVAGASRAVAVGAVQLISTPGRRTFVVVIRNLRSSPISDNPISVGVVGPDGHGISLNSAAGLPYFATHVPSVHTQGELRWVLSTTARTGSRPKPFAIVGRASAAFSSPPSPLPTLTITLVKRAEHPQSDGREITVRVRNGSSVPQYQLPVYAVERRGARYLAAGSASVPSLAPGASTEVGIQLFGRPTGGRLELEAPPTVYR